MTPPNLSAAVECGKGFKALRGTLSLSNGSLRFQTRDECVFDVSPASIEKIVWHWYSFSGAFEATIHQKNYFLSFVPRGASLGAWYAGLSTGRQWRAALEGRPAPTGGPLIARIFLAVYWLLRILILGVFLILALANMVDPSQAKGQRIFFGVGFVLVAIYWVLMIIQGVRAVVHTLRGR
jgi:hypothetical protein